MTAFLETINSRKKELATLVELLIERAEQQPEDTAYIFLQHGTEVARIDYRNLEQQARAIAAQLQARYSVGERALLLYPSGIEYITAFFGCLMAGIIAVPAYPPRPNQKLSQLLSIVNDAQAQIALTTRSLLTTLEPQWTKQPEIRSLNWIATDTLKRDLATAWQPPAINRNTLAFLQYTSGSTGQPKGVMVSHGNLLHNLSAIYRCFAHTPDSLGVIWLPLYHDMGLIGGVLQPLYGGFPVLLMSPLDFLQKPLRWLETISRYRATTSGGPNFAYNLCLRRINPQQAAELDLSSWDLAFTGAEPIRGETIEQFSRLFASSGFRREAFYPCYGMAETTLIVSGGRKTEAPVLKLIDQTALEQNHAVSPTSVNNRLTLVSCGQSLSDQKIIIVHPETRLPCPTQQVGEIWVCGPSITQGYWQQDEETQHNYQAYLADSGAGPFFRTGDLGFLSDGELFVTGRLKDVIIIHGQNYYPQDIELTVENSHPALRPGSGAAFSVEIKTGERLVIVQEIERSYVRQWAVNEVIENIRRSVNCQHDLTVYAILLLKTGSIPKTSSGKVQRHACRSGFLNGSLNIVEDWCEDPQKKIKFIHLQNEVETLLQKLSTSTR